MGREGLYRMEIYKKGFSVEDVVWDTEVPWRMELHRRDPFFHKPVVWESLAALLGVLVVAWIGWQIFLRTSPLDGTLTFRDARTGVVLRKIDLKEWKRRRVKLGRRHMKFVLPPMQVVRRGADAVRIQAGEKVKNLDIAAGEEKPLFGGIVVSYQKKALHVPREAVEAGETSEGRAEK